jgi:hypothetical protein
MVVPSEGRLQMHLFYARNIKLLQISIGMYLLHDDGIISASIENIIKHVIHKISCCNVPI